MRKFIPTVVLWSLLFLITVSVIVFSYGIVFTNKLPYWVGTKGYTDPTGKVLSQPKTFWDLMSLLIIPVSLAIIAFLLNRSERQAEIRRSQMELDLERKISDDRTQEENLLDYINRLNELIIDKNLLGSALDSPIRIVARTYTRVLVHRVNGKRRGTVMRFLKEAGLVNLSNTIFSLAGADFREANLESANLSNLNLSKINLSDAVLDRANLSRTNLVGANLSGASIRNVTFKGTNLSRANLSGTNLMESNLSDSKLIRSILVGAKLNRSVMDGAKFNGADLREADLCDTKLSNADLDGAKLVGAKYNFHTQWPKNFDYIKAGVQLVK